MSTQIPIAQKITVLIKLPSACALSKSWQIPHSSMPGAAPDVPLHASPVSTTPKSVFMAVTPLDQETLLASVQVPQDGSDGLKVHGYWLVNRIYRTLTPLDWDADYLRFAPLSEMTSALEEAVEQADREAAERAQMGETSSTEGLEPGTSRSFVRKLFGR